MLFEGVRPLGFDEVARPQERYLAAPAHRIAQTEKAEWAWLTGIRIVAFNASSRRPGKADAKSRAIAVVRKLDLDLVPFVEDYLSGLGQYTSAARLVLGDAQFVETVAEDDTNQYAERLLPVVGDFVPSLSLVSLWKDNLIALEDDANSTHKFLIPGRDSLTILQVEFKTVFEKALASLANRARFQRISELELINNLSFTPTAEFSLVDRLYLVPSRSGPVLSELAREFSGHLRRSGNISANWGELRATKRGVSYYLAVPRSEKTDKRARAKILK